MYQFSVFLRVPFYTGFTISSNLSVISFGCSKNVSAVADKIFETVFPGKILIVILISDTLLAIIIPLALILLLGILALIFWLFRDRIKKKLCPEKVC